MHNHKGFRRRKKTMHLYAEGKPQCKSFTVVCVFWYFIMESEYSNPFSIQSTLFWHSLSVIPTVCTQGPSINDITHLEGREDLPKGDVTP